MLDGLSLAGRVKVFPVGEPALVPSGSSDGNAKVGGSSFSVGSGIAAAVVSFRLSKSVSCLFFLLITNLF
jgi:hypothetical protein